MSDIYSMSRSDSKNMTDIYLVDDVGDQSIDRAMKILAGFSHGAEKAIGSALKRAAISGEAQAVRGVQNDYYIKVSDFKNYTKSKRRFITANGSTTVDIEFRGYHIPLMKFDTKVGKDGRVVTRAKRSSAKVELDYVFKQIIGRYGHEGVFERITEKRLPIEEKLGPSTPQMMANNDDLEQEVGDKVREVFEKRLEHEILAVMNGWRQK